MSLTYELYELINNFEIARRANRDRYIKAVNELEEYKGSQGYTRRIEQAKADRENADKALKSDVLPKINSVLSRMASAGENLKTKAPSTEAINLISALQMRTTVTRDELDVIARSLEGNPVAIRALADISANLYRKGLLKGTPSNYKEYIKEMDKGEVMTNIGQIRRYINRVIESPLTDTATIAGKYYSRHGKNINPDEMKQREEYTGERDFYLNAIGEHADMFTEAINGVNT